MASEAGKQRKNSTVRRVSDTARKCSIYDTALVDNNDPCQCGLIMIHASVG